MAVGARERSADRLGTSDRVAVTAMEVPVGLQSIARIDITDSG